LVHFWLPYCEPVSSYLLTFLSSHIPDIFKELLQPHIILTADVANVMRIFYISSAIVLSYPFPGVDQ
jgi:hypothetical protein